MTVYFMVMMAIGQSFVQPFAGRTVHIKHLN